MFTREVGYRMPERLWRVSDLSLEWGALRIHSPVAPVRLEELLPRVDEGEVWRRDGTYLGELVDGCYVLRRRNAAPRSPRVPIEPPSSLPALPSSSSWAPRPFFKKPTAGSGWEDALDEF
jgi:hypothetical protein